MGNFTQWRVKNPAVPAADVPRMRQLNSFFRAGGGELASVRSLLLPSSVTKVVAGLLSALLWLPTPAAALWVNLTPQQIDEALAHGKASYERARAEGRPIDDLDPEYVVDLGPEVGRAMLYTEFSTLALEARRWRAIGQPLTPDHVERVLSPIRGRIQISVTVIGPDRDFLRHHTVRLHQASTTHQPLSWDVFRGTPQSAAPRTYVTPGQYTFTTKDLDLGTTATLLLRDQAGHEIRAEFDFARLR